MLLFQPLRCILHPASALFRYQTHPTCSSRNNRHSACVLRHLAFFAPSQKYVAPRVLFPTAITLRVSFDKIPRFRALSSSTIFALYECSFQRHLAPRVPLFRHLPHPRASLENISHFRGSHRQYTAIRGYLLQIHNASCVLSRISRTLHTPRGILCTLRAQLSSWPRTVLAARPCAEQRTHRNASHFPHCPNNPTHSAGFPPELFACSIAFASAYSHIYLVLCALLTIARTGKLGARKKGIAQSTLESFSLRARHLTSSLAPHTAVGLRINRLSVLTFDHRLPTGEHSQLFFFHGARPTTQDRHHDHHDRIRRLGCSARNASMFRFGSRPPPGPAKGHSLLR